ncbi:MAG: hypothetical protein ACR2PZ_06745 [Pseudomonadales bacterium]
MKLLHRRIAILLPLLVSFDVSALPAAPLIELRHILPVPPGRGGRSGQSIAVGGGSVFVGSPFDNTQIIGGGSVSIFDLKSGAHLTSIDPVVPELWGRFHKVAANADTLVIGAGGDWNSRDDLAGFEYMFDPSNGSLLSELQPPSDAIFNNGDRAIDGDLLVVGGLNIAGVDDIANASLRQLALVYDLNTGSHVATLNPGIGPQRNDYSLAIHADFVLLGSNPTNAAFGTAILFDARSGRRLRRFAPANGISGFGDAVALNSEYALVGRPYIGYLRNFPGEVYVFDMATGQQLAKWTASDSHPDTYFGAEIAMNDRYAVIGAPGGRRGEESVGGKAYVFELATGREVAILSPDGNRATSNFGESIDIDGNTIVIGATGLGPVFVYEIIPEPNSVAMFMVTGLLVLVHAPRALRSCRLFIDRSTGLNAPRNI